MVSRYPNQKCREKLWQGKLTTTNQSFQIGLDGRARLGRNKPHALCTLQREIEGCGDWLGKINDENKFPLKGGEREEKEKGKEKDKVVVQSKLCTTEQERVMRCNNTRNMIQHSVAIRIVSIPHALPHLMLYS